MDSSRHLTSSVPSESPSQQGIRYWSQPHLQRPSLIRATTTKGAQSPCDNHPQRQLVQGYHMLIPLPGGPDEPYNVRDHILT